MDTASNLVFELVFIRALSVAHISSSLCYRLYPDSSVHLSMEAALCSRFNDQCSVHVHRGTYGKVEDIEI